MERAPHSRSSCVSKTRQERVVERGETLVKRRKTSPSPSISDRESTVFKGAAAEGAAEICFLPPLRDAPARQPIGTGAPRVLARAQNVSLSSHWLPPLRSENKSRTIPLSLLLRQALFGNFAGLPLGGGESPSYPIKAATVSFRTRSSRKPQAASVSSMCGGAGASTSIGGFPFVSGTTTLRASNWSGASARAP